MELSLPHTAPHPAPAWNIPAAIAAWVFPGLGHALSGDLKRGIILAIAIMTLWTGGLLIGGISVIESRSPLGQFHPWFLGQALIAPSLIIEYNHDRYRAVTGGKPPQPETETGEPALYEPAYGRPHEMGTLFTALAGLLNLLAILDVLYRTGSRKSQPDQPAAAPVAITPPTAAATEISDE